MSKMKRIFSLAVAALLVFAFTACHEAGEVVMTVDGIEIPSGLYLAIQMSAFDEFTGQVNESLGADTTVSSISDYQQQRLDDKDFRTWINDRTMELCLEYAAVQRLCEQYEVSLTDEEKDAVQQYSDYYWENGYGTFYEANGIGRTSFDTLNLFTELRTKLFYFYYDQPDEETQKGGINAVPEEEIMTGYNDNYILADFFSVPLTDENSQTLSDEAKQELETQLNDYAKRINDGDATFTQIQEEYEQEQGTSDDTTSSTADDTTDDTEKSAKFPNAQVVSSLSQDTTIYDLFKSVKSADGFAYERAYFVTGANAYYLTVIHDITTDEFYTDNEQYRRQIISLLRADAYTTLLSDQGKTYTVETDDSLIRYYNPNNIKEVA